MSHPITRRYFAVWDRQTKGLRCRKEIEAELPACVCGARPELHDDDGYYIRCPACCRQTRVLRTLWARVIEDWRTGTAVYITY